NPHPEGAPRRVLVVTASDLATVCAHDAVTNTQAEPGAFSRLFDCKKWIENPLCVGNSGAIVSERDLNDVAVPHCSNPDTTALSGFLHRVVRIVQYIQEYLLQLLRVAKRRREILIEFFDDLDSMTREIVTAKLDCLTQHGIDVHQFTLHGALTGEAQ